MPLDGIKEYLDKQLEQNYMDHFMLFHLRNNFFL